MSWPLLSISREGDLPLTGLTHKPPNMPGAIWKLFIHTHSPLQPEVSQWGAISQLHGDQGRCNSWLCTEAEHSLPDLPLAFMDTLCVSLSWRGKIIHFPPSWSGLTSCSLTSSSPLCRSWEIPVVWIILSQELMHERSREHKKRKQGYSFGPPKLKTTYTDTQSVCFNIPATVYPLRNQQ